MNLTEYDISRPYHAVVARTERITPENTDEVIHITLNIDSATFNYLEGQSIGVLVPGPHSFGNTHHMRLYSIASSRQGEGQNMSELSICVRRCFYIDEVSGERHPGVASNYLCERKAGDEILIVGPYGRQFLAPRDPSCNMLMIGVGTGIAPFRAFLKHIYNERKDWQGKVRLFYGANSGMDSLYQNDKNDDLTLYYDEETFEAFQALSPRPHLDDPIDMASAVKAHAEEVWAMIQNEKTYVYVAGLARLEEQMDEVLSEIAGSEEVWEATKQELITQRRWSTLFYA
ncbi:FAD-binding oxidoreductase [Kiritimatiellaeota bacterium B1221]|nr:FAD-binding oxidoreductase [Kiritimatiellaeota bacterium B1221]